MAQRAPEADEPQIDEAVGVVASAARIVGWAEIALAGSQFVYATRCYLPIGSEGARAARELQARGIVHLKQRRVAGTMQLNYIAERSSAAWSVAPEPRHPKGRSYSAGYGEAAAINVVYPILCRAARFCRPCPTDAQIADRAELNVEEIQPTLNAMAQMNMIRIEPARAPTLRLITIVASGHRTGLVA